MEKSCHRFSGNGFDKTCLEGLFGKMRLGVLFSKNDLGGYLTKCVAWGLLDKIRFRAGSMIKCVLGRYLAKRFSGGELFW